MPVYVHPASSKPGWVLWEVGLGGPVEPGGGLLKEAAGGTINNVRSWCHCFVAAGTGSPSLCYGGPDDLRVSLDARRGYGGAVRRSEGKAEAAASLGLRLLLGASLRPACLQQARMGLVAWKSLQASPWVVLTVTQGYRIQLLVVLRPRRLVMVVGTEHKVVLQAEVSTLLEKGSHQGGASGQQTGWFYSRYFLIPKKDGRLHPNLDLRGLNRHLRRLPCRMLTILRVRQSI